MTTDQAPPVPRSTPSPVSETAGIFHRRYLLVTLGACALVFLAAFESLAVTTIMPLVSRELDGAGLYALAFAGPLATGVIGMVAAGNWSDRRGPVAPLYASVAMFVLGLLIAGTAADYLPPGNVWAGQGRMPSRVTLDTFDCVNLIGARWDVPTGTHQPGARDTLEKVATRFNAQPRKLADRNPMSSVWPNY